MKLLFEIGCEELPPGRVVPSIDFLAKAFAEQAAAARLSHGAIETFATPRRLALRVSDVAEATPDLEETRTGPPARVAFDGDGKPTRAAEGFARGAGVSVDDLFALETPKGSYVAAKVTEKGQPAADVLAPILDGLITAIPWPKPMRWGWETTGWARPIHWIVALLGDDVLPVSFADVTSGRDSHGHRFSSPGAVTITSPDSYEAALEAADVIASVEKRRERVLAGAREAAAPDKLVEDGALLDEVTQLVELPQCAAGQFSADFLRLPREVLVSEMKEHQRYFAIEDEQGNLSNRFVVAYNTPVNDPDVVVRGNERVLVARLADGGFFFDRDRKRSLDSRVDSLGDVVWLKQLGSIRDKVERIVALSDYLADALYPDAKATAVRAARLCKADLVTNMVGEFPELQGTMGRYYAESDGEPAEVGVAIEEHYQPRGASDDVPPSPAGAIVSMADKLDSIAGCFSVGLEPTGAADPYGLRRAALGVIRTVLTHERVFSLERAIRTAVAGVAAAAGPQADGDEVVAKIERFFKARLKAMLGDEISGDIIDAVVSTGIDDLVSVVERIRVLSSMRSGADFEPLAVAFKRVANILKMGTPDAAVDPGRFEEDAERELWSSYASCRELVAAKLEARDYRSATETLITLKAPVDQFFDDVLVMAEDEGVRTNRLGMLRDLRSLFNTVADISRIQVDA